MRQTIVVLKICVFLRHKGTTLKICQKSCVSVKEALQRHPQRSDPLRALESCMWQEPFKREDGYGLTPSKTCPESVSVVLRRYY